VSGLQESLLLDAAHIIADKDEESANQQSQTASRSPKSITPRSTPT
jgi:hypothetical protein